MTRVRRVLLFGLCAAAFQACSDPSPPIVPEPPRLIDPNGDAQTGIAGSTLALPIAVTVSNAQPGTRIRWTVISGDGSVTGGSQTGADILLPTIDSGRSSVSWTLGPNGGPQSLMAQVEGYANTQISFSASAIGPAVVARYDGSSWTPMTAGDINQFDGVNSAWGTSASNVYVSVSVTSGLNANSSHPCAIAVLHWDGASWHKSRCVEASTGLCRYTGNTTGRSGSDVVWIYGAGCAGTKQSWIERFDGATWTIRQNNVASACSHRSTWAAPDGVDLFSVGDCPYVLHWDGVTTSQAPCNCERQNLPANSGFAQLGIWGTSKTNVVAVGAGQIDQSSYGVIVRYRGSTWTTEFSPTIGGPTVGVLRAVHGTSATNIFAVGDQGTILHYDGASWSLQTSGTTASLKSVWAIGPNDVYAVGGSSTMLHYDGTAWKPVTALPMNFTGIWASSSTNIIATGIPLTSP